MGIDYLTPADRYFGVEQDAEKALDISFDSGGDIYLAGRIEGQPVRAKENSRGKIDIYLAGQKQKTLTSKKPLKELFALG